MDREKVIETVLSASTYEECRRAEQILQAWMQAHPDDLAMLDAGESLAMTLEGLKPAERLVAEAGRTTS